MKYEVIRTDRADADLRGIILHIAETFGDEKAIEKLNEIESNIRNLEITPYIGAKPRYPVLKRQGYRILIMEKNLAIYKVDEKEKKVIIYAVVDQRQDYINIINGM